MRSRFSYIYILVLSLFLYGCAQVVAPTGGERDLLPPKVLSTSPENESTSFNSNEITITFDEYIQLNNVMEEVTISPPLNNKPSIQLKGKSINIQLEDTLLENTTYSINFGNSIKDNHEGNTLTNYQFAFSTGEQIDTLTVSGLALDAFTIEPVDKMLIMLYKNPTDSTPYFELPRYITKTNKDGEFKFNNIKEGDYLIFGLDDKNRNLKFDQANEVIAFQEELIKIDKNLNNIKLFTFLEDKNRQYLKKSEIKRNRLQLILNQPAETLNLNILSDEVKQDQLIKQVYKNKDTVDFFFLLTDSISTSAEVIANGEIIDTIKVVAGPRSNSDSILTFKQSFPSGSHKISKPITVSFTTPIQDFDKEKITVLRDSIPTDFMISYSNENKKSLSLNTELIEASNYDLKILPGAFVDIHSRTNDTINSVFKTTEFKDYGNLSVTINTTANQNGDRMIVQLTNMSKQAVATSFINNNETINFKHLDGGNYKLKVVFDSNGNGKWDTGDFIKQKLPEKVALYEGEITIRSNWDKKIDWNITP